MDLAGLTRTRPRLRLVEVLDQSPWTRLTPPAEREITLGTCVRVSPGGGHGPERMKEEGVVIEVVAPDQAVQSARVRVRPAIAKEERYVVQCWACRVLRPASGLVVVSP